MTLVGDDVDQNNLTFAIQTFPIHGTLSALGTVNCNLMTPTACTSSVTYTPNPDYNGPDSWTFTTSDGSLTSNTATVTVTVIPVNDTPRTNAEDTSTQEDTKAAFDVLANDTGMGDTPLVITVSAPAGHTFVQDANNRLVYTPPLNYTGSFNYTYTVRDADGEISSARNFMTVTPVDDPPVAVDDTAPPTSTGKPVGINVLANDFDVDNDPLGLNSWSNGQFGTVTQNPQIPTQLIYTPNPGTCVNGDTFTYRARSTNNNVPSNLATVKIVCL